MRTREAQYRTRAGDAEADSRYHPTWNRSPAMVRVSGFYAPDGLSRDARQAREVSIRRSLVESDGGG